MGRIYKRLNEYQIALSAYWVGLGISLFIIPWWVACSTHRVIFHFKNIFSILFFFIGFWIITWKKNLTRSIVLFLLAVIIIWIMPSHDEMKSFWEYIRNYFSLFTIGSYLYLFHFIVDKQGELESNNSSYLSLVHSRYLEYLRNFIWISVFVLLTLVTVYVTFSKEQLGGLAGPAAYPRVVWLLHICISYLAGILLVLYAFHISIKKIEQESLNAEYNKNINQKSCSDHE